MPLFRGKEILILEDAADILLQMRQVLGADGALVEDTRTARSGLASAQEMLPHLIIVDLGLTGGGALQFLQDLKFRYKVVPQKSFFDDYLSVDLFTTGKAAMTILPRWARIPFRHIKKFDLLTLLIAALRSSQKF